MAFSARSLHAALILGAAYACQAHCVTPELASPTAAATSTATFTASGNTSLAPSTSEPSATTPTSPAEASESQAEQEPSPAPSRCLLEYAAIARRPPTGPAWRELRDLFGRYLGAIHLRIHPTFEAFIKSSGKFGRDESAPEKALWASVELVIDGASGTLEDACIVKPSGDADFDAGVTTAVRASFPVGPVPPNILSADGNVHVIWEFHEDPKIACTTYNAQPYMLK